MSAHHRAKPSMAHLIAAGRPCSRPRSQWPQAIQNTVSADEEGAGVFRELSNTLVDFRSNIDKRVAAVERDVDAVTNKLAGQIAAGGAPTGAHIAGKRDPRTSNPNLAAYTQAFNTYFRKGEGAIQGGESALRQLEVQASMSVGSNPDGGYTVLPEIEQTIDSVLAPISPMRSLATVIQISSPEYRKLTNISPSASGWVGESDVRPQTDGAKFIEAKFPAMELYSMPAATQSLLDDAFVDIGQWIANEVGQTFARQEGIAFISGDGIMKPTGILSYPVDDNDDFNPDGSRDRAWGKLQYIGAGASPSDADVVTALVSATESLGVTYRANASWIVPRAFLRVVRQLKDSTGRLLFSDDGRIATGTPATLLGYPIHIDDAMPAPGANAVVAAFGDFRQGYLIIDRIGIRVLRDPFTAKPFILFYTTKRVGGGVQNYDAIKLIKYSN